MSDILFRYLLMARQRDRSLFRRLFLSDEQLLGAGVEQLVESAAARVTVTSQHERVSTRRETVPASRHRSVRFYDEAQPRRPAEGQFERRTDEFPLRHSLNVYTCTKCRGSGEIRCHGCGGTGRNSCGMCGGSGRVMSQDGKRRSCGTCGGSGRQTCFRCHGRGRLTCPQCQGEGRLASWEVEVYQWLVEERLEDTYPLEEPPRRLSQAYGRWLALDSDLIDDFESVSVAEHLGYETPQAFEVAARADAERRRLEEEARQSPGRFLFLRSDRSLSPAGYTVVRSPSRASYYWLVGRGERAQEVRPRGRADVWKCLGWLGLVSIVAIAFSLVVRMATLPEGALLAGLAGMIPGAVAAIVGIRRVVAREDPVLSVGLLPATGQPTAWLTCLAYVGSYTERLRVLDRSYDIQSEQLLGKMRPPHQSGSLNIELPDGRRVRLVEVAHPQRLSDDQILSMLQGLDSVMVIEDQGPSSGLESRIRSASEGLAADERPAIGGVTVDRTENRDPHEGTDMLALVATRRLFVEDVQREADWNALYERIWRPLADLLPAKSA